ncbi:MAG TPA: hypothetical protein PLZ43_13820 [bacterium]|nr:hypothetical protein [bacterium]
MLKVFFCVVLIFSIFTACDSEKVKFKIKDGQENGDCYDNGTCDDGLICEDDKCVEDPSKNDSDSGNTSDENDVDFGNTGNTSDENDNDSGNTGNTGDDKDFDTGNTGDTVPDDVTDNDTGNTGDTEDEVSDPDLIDSDDTIDFDDTNNDADLDIFDDPCDPNPCTSILNSDGVCTTDTDDFICGCNKGFKWDGSICKSHNEFIIISSGGYHTCGINYDEKLRCWGGNTWGQLGIGSDATKCSPEKVDDYQWTAISAGIEHTCGIRKTGSKLYCWGKNNFGELGFEPLNNSDFKNTPTKVNDNSWKEITAGSMHSCGITSDGTLYCWGHGTYGELGDGTLFSKGTPTKIGTDKWLKISAGSDHTCGIKEDNKLYCWGWNSEGQLGLGTSGTDEYKTEPTKVNDDTWSNISAGNAAACGIKSSDKKLYCWGYKLTTTPIKVNDDTWKNVELGYNHKCGIKEDNKLYCWGSNYYGQLGDGTGGDETSNNDKLIPTSIDSKWTILSAGGWHTCGNDRENKELYCWGQNNAGQIGTGTCDSLNHASPQKVDFVY